MTFEAWLTLSILTATFVCLVATKLPPVTVFLGALTLCITFGLAPIALSMAIQLEVSFMPFAIALMTGTIGAVVKPPSYQTNLMVMGPGGTISWTLLR